MGKCDKVSEGRTDQIRTNEVSNTTGDEYTRKNYNYNLYRNESLLRRLERRQIGMGRNLVNGNSGR